MAGELDSAAETIYQALAACLPDEEAAAMIRAKPALLADTYRKLLPELKARAFTVAGIARADALQRIRDRIAELPQGADWDEARDDILQTMSPYVVTATDDEGRAAQMAGAERHAELLMRQHAFQAYQAGMYDLMDKQRDAFPYWQYLTVGDDKVRPSHAALDKLILPADSPFWATHYPHWDWGCRCQVVPITASEYAQIAAGESPADGRTLSPAQMRELERSNRLALPDGQVISVAPPQGEGAFAWHPGDLRIPLDDLRSHYDDEVWRRFEADMRSVYVEMPDGKMSVWDWLSRQ